MDQSSSPSTADRDSPFHRYSDERREALITRLNEDEELLEDTRATDLYHLLLVLWDVRPGCSLSAVTHTDSTSAAEIQAHLPQEYTFENPVEDLLREFDIPFYREVNLFDNGERIQVSANYHVSFEQERREMIQNQLSERSSWGSPSDNEDRAVGQFLGYPEQAVQEYAESWDGTGETFFDQLTQEELLEQLGPTRLFVEKIEESTRFVRFLLPYVVPATVEHIDERVFNDFERFLAVGIVSLAEYDIGLIQRVLKYYRGVICEGE